jgi:hypothetical protein
MAANFFGLPMARVSLIDEDRVWFKSRVRISTEQTGLDSGLSSSTMLWQGVYCRNIFSTLASLFASLARRLARLALRKIDRDARDVAHVILEDIQRYVSDRLDDFAIAQTAGTRAPEVCVGEFTTLDHDAAGELEDRVRSGVGRARSNRVVDFNSTQSDFRGHRRVLTQAVRAKVAFGDGERELLASFFVEGPAGKRRAQTHESFKRRRRIGKNSKQVRDQCEFRSYFREDSLDRPGCAIGINWLDAILVSGFAHRCPSTDSSRLKTAFVPSSTLPKSASEHGVLGVSEKLDHEKS